MSWRHYLFGLSGRITRLQYWRFALLSIGFVLAGALVAMPYVLIEHPNASDPSKPVSAIAIATFAGEGVVVLAFLFANLAILAKRLHDRNKSVWWLLLFLAAPPVLGQIAEELPSRFAAPPWVAPVVLLLAVAANLWGFVEIGLLRGTQGENRYGPDPLAGR